jgi:O-acetyl-ADP-ribose deacetylase (regulator of RNase III)
MADALTLEVAGGTVRLLQGDITRLAVDGVVNAANESLMGGGGVDGAIHQAGGPEILDECREHARRLGGPLPTGQVVATTAGRMPARKVLHTVGPVYDRHGPGEAARLLAACYRNSLTLARELGLNSVAFPCISTGVFGYPPADAAEVAIAAVLAGLRERQAPREVVFCVFGDSDRELYRRSLPEKVQGG